MQNLLSQQTLGLVEEEKISSNQALYGQMVLLGAILTGHIENQTMNLMHVYTLGLAMHGNGMIEIVLTTKHIIFAGKKDALTHH